MSVEYTFEIHNLMGRQNNINFIKYCIEVFKPQLLFIT